MRDIWRLVHPASSFISGILSFTMAVQAFNLSEYWLLFRVLPIVFVTMAGFIINDIFDIQRDKFRGDEKPIASGKLTISASITLLFILIFLSFSVEGIFGEWQSFKIILITLIAVFLYTPFAHRFPVIKGLYTAVLCCAPLLYGSAISHRQIPIIMYIVLCTYVVGRELLLDTKDLQYDLSFGIKTPAAHLGEKASPIIAWTLMWLSIVVLLFFMKTTVGIILASTALIFLGVSQVLSFSGINRSVWTSRMAMLLGALAISSTVFH